MRSLGRRCFSALILLLTVAGWSAVVAAQTLSPDPVFALNAQSHTGFALHLDVTPDERQVITGGFDKTIRVWDTQTGQLLRRFTLPVRDGEDGSIEAISLSPDGERLAIGGYIAGFGKGLSVLVMSLRDGKILKTISGFALDARTVKWSKDGRLLAVGTDGRERASRIHVFDTTSWKKVFEERDIRGRIEVIEFRKDGRFFAATNNGTIDSEVFLYRPEGSTFVRVGRVSLGKRGTWRGSWTADETHFYINGHSYFSGEDLSQPLWIRGRPPAAEGFSQLRESVDGKRVYAAPWHHIKGKPLFRRYDDRSLRSFEEVAIPETRVADFAVLKSGQVVYVAQDGTVAAIGPDLKPMWRQSAPSVSFRNDPDRLKVSTDGKWVTLPLGDHSGESSGDKELAFNLFEPRYARVRAVGQKWIEPLTSRRGMQLLAWSGTSSGTINDAELPKVHGRERTLSAAVHSTDPALVLGTSSGRLRKVDAAGKQLWVRYVAAEVTAVTLVESAGLVIAASEDGFLRVLRWEDGATVLTYYLQPATRKWLAVANTGHYQASIGAEDLAGWIVNRDTEHMADFYPLSRFRERYLLPGFAAESLSLRDSRKGVEKTMDARMSVQNISVGEREKLAQEEAKRLDDSARQAKAALQARLEAAEREAAGEAIAGALAVAEPVVEKTAEAAPAPSPVVVPVSKVPTPPLAAAATPPVSTKLPAPVAVAPPAPASVASASPSAPVPPALPAAQAIQPAQPVVAAAPVVQQPAAPRVEQLPPAIDLLSPGFDTEVSQPTLNVRLKVRSPDGAPVTMLSSRVISVGQSARREHPVGPNGEATLVITLPQDNAELQLLAENRFGPSVPVSVKIRYSGEKPIPVSDKPVLHLLAVGVSEYDNPSYRLDLAAKDARDFSQSLSAQGGKLYERVELTVLTDQTAGKLAIEAALATLRKKVRAQDTTFVFLAGHGVNDGAGEYLYLPREADIARLRETGVSFRLLRKTLASLPGRTLMFVDTCHAGNALGESIKTASRDNTAAINDLAAVENNIIVFASSTGAQESLELAEWGNGAFTKALVEGLRGAADFKKRGRVTYKQLDAYVSDRVDELTSGKQTPVTPVLVTVPDFTLAEVQK